MGNAADIAARRNKRRLAGLCTECGGTPVPGRLLCERCQAIRDAANARARAKRERHSLCYCGKPREMGRTRCRQCLDLEIAKQNARTAERVERGLCRQCGTERATRGTQLCKKCSAKRNLDYADKRVGEIRKRLREMIAHDRIPFPDRLKPMARFLLGAMVEVAVPNNCDHWRPNEWACRQYAASRPEFEGLILAVRSRRNGSTHRVFLLTRDRSHPNRERLDLVCIPTSDEVPWRQYG